MLKMRELEFLVCAQFTGREAKLLFEHPAEVLGARKSHLIGDLGNVEPGVLQQGHGFLKAHGPDKL